MKVTHEILETKGGYGHRVVSDKAGKGEYVGYTRPAYLKTRDGMFVAVTDYWKGVEPFPVPGKIYLVKEKT